MLKRYFTALYRQTMDRAYAHALEEIHQVARGGGQILDCGAHNGTGFKRLQALGTIDPAQFHGIEWNDDLAQDGRRAGLDIVQGDLNRPLEQDDDAYDCVYALSVLEHLLNGCRFLRECHRIIKPDGKLVILTPNISTYFTAALVLMGKMPSSGPHPDSDALMKSEEVFKVSSTALQWDTEADTPVHRHLVVFSYRVLKKYLSMAGFRDVRGYGFGLYPFPRSTQRLLERMDPWHCHQMVFIARK